MKSRYPTLLLITATLSAFSLAGCGQSEKTAAGAVVPDAKTAPAATSSKGPKEGRIVEIICDDKMKFTVSEIRATPGEAIAVKLTNQGTMPKFSMGHNWVLLAAGVSLEAFANDASTAAKTDYVPATYKDRILASTKLLGPKETDTAIFHAPKAPGRYPFLCSFPGHFQVGMKGELVVE